MEPEIFRLEAELQSLENATLRRRLSMQRAVIFSLLLHGSIVALILLFPEAAKRPIAATTALVIERDPPVPITFIVPAPPPVPAEPRVAAERPPESLPDRPSPDERYDDVPLRMEPTPARPKAPADAPRTERSAALGQRDDRTAGGESGGSRSESVRGAPNGGVEPKRPDLSARLREFRRALGAIEPEPGNGPEGSGPGRGGISMPELPGTGFGVGNLEFESRDYDWGDYGRAIYVAIWRAWHARLLISAGVFERWSIQNREPTLDHRTVVRFVIERSGEVTGVVVETPSGCYPLDDSAADALRAVILPPLPDDFPRDTENVRALFIATGEIRMLRPTLEWLRQRGYF